MQATFHSSRQVTLNDLIFCACRTLAAADRKWQPFFLCRFFPGQPLGHAGASVRLLCDIRSSALTTLEIRDVDRDVDDVSPAMTAVCQDIPSKLSSDRALDRLLGTALENRVLRHHPDIFQKSLPE